jgi:hypothetical protein
MEGIHAHLTRTVDTFLKVLQEKIEYLKRFMFSFKHVMQPVVDEQTCLAVQDSEHVIWLVRSSMSFRLAF